MARTHCRGCGNRIWWSGTEVRNRPIMLDPAPAADGTAVLVPADRGHRVRILSQADAVALPATRTRYRVHSSRCQALQAGAA